MEQEPGNLLPSDFAAIRTIVQEEIKDRMSDAEIRRATMIFLSVLREQTRLASGDFLIGGVQKVLAKVVLVLGIGLAVYWAGGWSNMTLFLKSVLTRIE